MTFLTGQSLTATVQRIYHIQVPDNPPQALLPVIIVFHGGGQDVRTIAARWGVNPPNPVPTLLQNYLLVFPESDPRLGKQWVHLKAGDVALSTLDLEFVRQLLGELTTRGYPTVSATVPTVSADPDLAYAAGFSNGGGMVWQLLNSGLAASFQGFAAVGKALDPEKATHYRAALAASGAVPAPSPVVYIQGTADRGYRSPCTQEETKLDETLPFFTVQETMNRNVIPLGPANTRLIAGSTGVTEVVLQLFTGAAAFLLGTVINGGHNWPTPTTIGNPPVASHFDATRAIIEFWRANAGLP
jgi:poly(3-hydroxybutyrate) depolymerase